MGYTIFDKWVFGFQVPAAQTACYQQGGQYFHILGSTGGGFFRRKHVVCGVVG